MNTFWMVSEGQPSGENSGHTFFLFCLSILLTSLYPPHAEGVWGQTHLSLLRGDQEHNQSQGKSLGWGVGGGISTQPAKHKTSTQSIYGGPC